MGKWNTVISLLVLLSLFISGCSEGEGVIDSGDVSIIDKIDTKGEYKGDTDEEGSQVDNTYNNLDKLYSSISDTNEFYYNDNDLSFPISDSSENKQDNKQDIVLKDPYTKFGDTIDSQISDNGEKVEPKLLVNGTTGVIIDTSTTDLINNEENSEGKNKTEDEVAVDEDEGKVKDESDVDEGENKVKDESDVSEDEGKVKDESDASEDENKTEDEVDVDEGKVKDESDVDEGENKTEGEVTVDEDENKTEDAEAFYKKQLAYNIKNDVLYDIFQNGILLLDNVKSEEDFNRNHKVSLQVVTKNLSIKLEGLNILNSNITNYFSDNSNLIDCWNKLFISLNEYKSIIDGMESYRDTVMNTELKSQDYSKQINEFIGYIQMEIGDYAPDKQFSSDLGGDNV